MALPQQAIERFMQDPSKTQGVYGQLLMFSGTIFFISIVIALGLMYGYQPYLDNKEGALQAQIQELSNQVPRTEQDVLANSYSQFVNLQKLLNVHGMISPALDWLSAATQPNIYFANMNYMALNKQVSLSGIAKTLSDIAEQVAILERDSHVKRVTLLNTASTDVEGVTTIQFALVVSLKDDIFKITSISPTPTPAQ